MSSPRRLIEAVEVTESGVHIVRLMRIFDASSVTEFEKVLGYLMARGHFKLVVDLTNVEFVASAGWGALTAEFRRVRDNNGDIRLAGMNPDVLDVFFLLELDSFMSAYDTLEAALASFEIDDAPVAEASAPTPQEAVEEFAPAPELAVPELEPEVTPAPAVHVPAPPKEPKKKKSPAPSVVSSEPAAVRPPANSHAKAQQSVASRPENTEKHATPAPAATPLIPAEEEEEAPSLWEESQEEAHTATEAVAPAAALSNPKAAPAAKQVPVQSRPRKTKAPKRAAQKPAPKSSAAAGPETKQPAGSESRGVASPIVLREVGPASEAPARVNKNDEAKQLDFEVPEESAGDDFEMQDIHDPWLLDEIDTLPEEFEMEEGAWPGHSGLDEIAGSGMLDEEEIRHSEYVRPQAYQPSGAAVRREERPHPVRRKSEPAVRAEPEAPVTLTASTPPARQKTVRKKRTAPKKRTPKEQPPVPVMAQAPPAEIVPAFENLPIARQVSGAVRTAVAEKPQPLQKSPYIVKVSSEGDCVELVRQIVKEHPHYGPTMIGKFFETRVEPPVKASRSTIYRWLRLAGLNTRDQRTGFAGQNEDVSAIHVDRDVTA